MATKEELKIPSAKTPGYQKASAISIEAIRRYKNSDERSFAIECKCVKNGETKRVTVKDTDSVLTTLHNWTDVFSLQYHTDKDNDKFVFPEDNQPIITIGYVGSGVMAKPFISDITSPIQPTPESEKDNDLDEALGRKKGEPLPEAWTGENDNFYKFWGIVNGHCNQYETWRLMTTTERTNCARQALGGRIHETKLSLNDAAQKVIEYIDNGMKKGQQMNTQPTGAGHWADDENNVALVVKKLRPFAHKLEIPDERILSEACHAMQIETLHDATTTGSAFCDAVIGKWFPPAADEKENQPETPRNSTQANPTATTPQGTASTPSNPPTIEPAKDMKTEIVNADIIEEINSPVSLDVPSEIVIFDPQRSLNHVRATSDLITAMMRDRILVESGKDEKGNEVDGDYGRIAGSKKPALYKSGAEKLCEAFGLRPEFPLLPDSISDWNAPFFYFHYKCELYRISDGKLIATANGSCNSREDKYGWRWVELDKVPAKHRAALVELEQRPNKIWSFKFSVEEAKTDGQYGKPAEYWQAFHNAIENGTASLVKRTTKSGKETDAWEIDGTTYRIPNPDIYSIVNTIDKMAQKRALVAAVLIGTAASRYFTQDIEEMPDFGMVA